MKVFYTHVKQHSLALVFAVVVGTLSVLPTVLAPLALGDGYQGVQFFYLNDETIYRARIHEILDGHSAVASPFLSEYKDAAAVVPPINEFFYAVPAFVLGLSGAVVFAKFVFPLVLFLLVYLLVVGLLSSLPLDTKRLTAITCGLLVTLGYDLVDVGWVKTLLMGDAGTHLLIWTRLVNPVTAVLVAFTALIVMWRIMNGKSKLLAIPLAAILAVSVGYFFSFAVCYVFLGLLTLVALVHKDYPAARAFIVAGLLSLLIDASYWQHTLSTIGGEAGRAAALKNGMSFTHHPIVNKLVLAATLFVGALFGFGHFAGKEIYAKNKNTWLFILAMLATSWIVFAQQLVTGKAIWPDHFVQFTIPFVMVSVLSASALALASRFPRLWKYALSLLVVVSIALGTYSAGSYTYSLKDFSRQQETYGPLLSWLNINAPRECVVMLREWNEELERTIPGYSNCNVYSTQYVYSVVPPDRVLHNFVLRMRLLEVDPQKAEEYLYADENDVRGYFFENWGQLYMSTQGRDAWLDAKVSMVANAYRESLKQSLDDEIRQYRIDYLYAATPLSMEMLKELPGISVAQQTAHYTLYSIPAR